MLGNVYFTDSNSIYKCKTLFQNALDNSAGYGGVFYCSSCTMSIDKAFFFTNFVLQGGGFYIDNYANLTLTNSIINGSFS